MSAEIGGYESSTKHEFKGLIREVFNFCLFILFASLRVELFDGPLHPLHFSLRLRSNRAVEFLGDVQGRGYSLGDQRVEFRVVVCLYGGGQAEQGMISERSV